MRPLLIAVSIAVAVTAVAWLQSPPQWGGKTPHANTNTVAAQGSTSNEKAAPNKAPSALQKDDAPQTSSKAESSERQRDPEALGSLSASEKIALGASVAAVLQFIILAATWWTMIRTARREQRAYIHYKQGSIVNFDADCPIVQVKVKNFGRTPAYAVRTMSNIHVTGFPLAKPLPPLDATTAQPRGVVPPSSHFILLRTLDDPKISPSRKDDIRNGRAALYVYGKITYIDAFGKKRWTTYRSVYGGDAELHPDGDFAACEDGNDAT